MNRMPHSSTLATITGSVLLLSDLNHGVLHLFKAWMARFFKNYVCSASFTSFENMEVVIYIILQCLKRNGSRNMKVSARVFISLFLWGATALSGLAIWATDIRVG